MRLKQITFDVDAEGASAPSLITVEMTATEAAYLAVVVGKSTHLDREEVMPGGGDAGSEVFDCLTGDVFNRYYDDGVQDYLRGRRA
jgi:hypothetical protein